MGPRPQDARGADREWPAAFRNRRDLRLDLRRLLSPNEREGGAHRPAQARDHRQVDVGGRSPRTQHEGLSRPERLRHSSAWADSRPFIVDIVDRFAKVSADDGRHCDALAAAFEIDQVKPSQRYNDKGTCANQAESNCSRVDRIEMGTPLQSTRPTTFLTIVAYHFPITRFWC